MKILLIYPDVSSIHGLPYHPGLASIASFLLAKGHEVRVNYFSRLDEERDILKKIIEFGPNIIGFTAVETQFHYVKQLASEIKRALKAPIVCGGPYVTLAPEVVMDSANALDAVIIGEGEYAMAEILEKLEKGGNWLSVNNLAYKGGKSNRLVKNPLSPLMDDLDSLPYPSTELFPYQEIIDKDNIAVFHFNRGCPYQCRFCSNAALGKVYGLASNRLRYRSVGSVIEEISAVLSKYRLKEDTLLYFGDDLLIFNREWILEFCRRYSEVIGRPFWCTGRSNHMTEEICAALKRAGCSTLMMSVESGNDFIRNDVMGRNISRETMFKSFELCHKHGINTLASCIIGLPFETPEMIEDSISTVAKLKSITSYGINIFYPYQGTQLRKVCEENNLMPTVPAEDFVERTGSILRLPALSPSMLDYYRSNWVRLVMKHKGFAERAKYAVWSAWGRLRKTSFGRQLRHFVNNTTAGKKFKNIVMQYIWGRS